MAKVRIKRAKIHFCDEEINAALEVIKSGRYVKGPNVSAFEEEFAKFVGTKHAVAVNSGTSALIAALLAAGVKRGDEVITTPFTFMATGNAILIAGGKPVLVDIDEDSMNIDPGAVKKAVTPKTKAIMPVHLYGQSADMDPILEVATEKDLIIVEDAAQAVGAKYKGDSCGTFGDINCFSFYPTKNMTVCGDGGMITTDNPELYEKSIMYRDAGRKKGDIERSYVPGYNFRLSELHAAIGRAQLKHVKKWNEERRQIATWYDKYLSGTKELILPEEMEYAYHIYHLYSPRAQRRDQLLKFLEQNGVEAGTHYPIPLHVQETFKHLGYGRGDFPKSEKAADMQISLPVYPGLKEKDIQYVAEQIKKFYKK
ncbi:TPA: DegT/DnrJ/EryC1/StrS family aminotransferase [archaeon]|uniref:DegT/DnrJ/EryC1/StrS family aminotransferase n=1 Tax=Candidatus Naiadarchaeum limnaeum TaxID=2756139 RepID=A0A832UVZ4_9ARCH|nr:DegT/DnrJ/EryC1/StrS family aminotransferase [Candidatus Naiadarchaeales archaeon SRR2090153.bin1042]HIK00775.1 DegT/DnrJ/EryC1/StrS family aminotransferase [Candidatus Naiadarchaeum limnaeum]